MTWPPGDERGHWSPLFDFYGQLLERGHKLNIPDPVTQARSTALAKETPRILTTEDQSIVSETIAVVLTTGMERLARIYAAAIERTHVHLLLSPLDEPLDRVIGRFKGRTSSEVIARGSEPGRTRTWTAGFWKVFLFEHEIVPTVARYIESHNERRGLTAAPYQWITPWRD